MLGKDAAILDDEHRLLFNEPANQLKMVGRFVGGVIQHDENTDLAAPSARDEKSPSEWQADSVIMSRNTNPWAKLPAGFSWQNAEKEQESQEKKTASEDKFWERGFELKHPYGPSHETLFRN